MANELMKKTYELRERLDSEERHYVFNDEMKMTFEKRFEVVSSDMKLMALATDHVGMVSDCYILYAIGHLGLADKESILEFLKALARKYNDLHVVASDKAILLERIRALHNVGFVYKMRYHLQRNKDGKVERETITFYSLSEDGYGLVNQCLQKRMTINKFIQNKPLQEKVGWLCAAYVGSRIANTNSFVDYLDRRFKTTMLGSVYLPCEVLTKVGENSYYVAVMSSFLAMNESFQTPRDFVDFCAFKINTMRNYLCCRTKKGTPIIVVAVADNADLNEIASYIYNAGTLEEFYDQIYFTGEGPLSVAGKNICDCFLQIYRDSSNERGYNLRYAAPSFLERGNY